MRETIVQRVRGAVRDRGTSPALTALSSMIEGTGAVARSATVFGAPVVSGGTTVVPVSRISVLTTMGGGSSRLFVSGGSGFVRARPAGFLVLDGDGARFRSIRQPATMLAIPLAVVAALTATRIVGVSLREARRRRDRRAEAAAEAERPV